MQNKIKYGLQKLRILVGDLIPNTKTNILSIIINGIDFATANLEYMLQSFKRDTNILETENIKALRTLVAMNGYEPVLYEPAKGTVSMLIKPTIFSENGANIYLTPFAQFKCQFNGLNYYYDNPNPLKLETNNYIPLTQGEIKTETFVIESTQELYKLLLDTENIVNDSFKLMINGKQYKQVKKLVGNTHSNIFIVKHSNSIDFPIILYINNTKEGDIITLHYKTCEGIDGIINDNTIEFITNNIIDSAGKLIDYDGNDIKIKYFNGFSFAGIGTSVDAMRAQIGYNHNNGIIFDSNSYREFLNRYANILINNIQLHNKNKSINDIYISKKIFIKNLPEKYDEIIIKDLYKFNQNELDELDKLISEHEYALSSHNLFNTEIHKYAFQIKLNYSDIKHTEPIKNLIYDNFIKFLNNKSHIFNVNTVFNQYMDNNKIKFDYTLFDSLIEEQKIKEHKNLKTNYIIKNDKKLPILLGDFNIATENYNKYKLNFNINVTFKQ